MSEINLKNSIGRERPPYKPQEIRCPNCDAQLKQMDEHSELIVCQYCASHIDLTSDQKRVLGKGPAKKWEFPLEIGDSFTWEKIRYEVLARMVFMEDNDVNEITREYLLFNPRHGKLWLDEYDNVYYLSRDSHVLPEQNPMMLKRGDLLNTHDGKKWTMQESGILDLVYVDGALPWRAKAGDSIDYFEFVNNHNTGHHYDVQRIKREVEYGTGHTLTPKQLRAALGDKQIEVKKESKTENAAVVRRNFKLLFAVCVIALLFNVVNLIYVAAQGSHALTQVFEPDQLTGETLSDEFKIAENETIIKVKIDTNLNNAWMSLDTALVKGEDTVVHIYDSSISYYHGVEGGESWSEGSRSDSAYIYVPESGTYRLLLKAVSATGNTSKADQARHPVQIKVYSTVLVPGFFIFSSILSLAALIGAVVLFTYWKNDGFDED
ncbi:MAG: DUF4178 domain-containing protein [Spirochaetes bacterium]|jgi:hypothetical protein|nr:DUF4178 domain-containing protein [Spirochaetota bacterium]